MGLNEVHGMLRIHYSYRIPKSNEFRNSAPASNFSSKLHWLSMLFITNFRCTYPQVAEAELDQLKLLTGY